MITPSRIITAPFIVLIIATAYLSGKLILMEGYHPLNPLIDTFHTDSYSIEKFNQLTLGDTKQKAIALLGTPLYEYKDTATNSITYYYTGDGKLLKKANDQNKREYQDFAWYRSSITVDSNKIITAIDKGWSYD